MRYLIFVIILLFPSVSHSIVTIESFSDDLRDGLTLNLGLGGELLLGNNDAFTISPALRMDYVLDSEYRFLVLGKYDYGESGQGSIKNEGFAHLRWIYISDGKGTRGIGYEIFTQAQYDTFKSLTLRQLNGIGYRVELSGSEDGLTFGTSFMTDYELLKEGKGDGLVYRNSTYFSYTWKEKMTSNEKVVEGKKPKYVGSIIGYLQPRFDKPSDLRFLLTGQHETPIGYDMSLVFNANYLYDSRPPTSVSSHDFKAVVALKLTI